MPSKTVMSCGRAEVNSRYSGWGYVPATHIPLSLKEDAEYYWYRPDRLGIPRQLTSSTGLVVWAGEFDAFGNVHILIDDIHNPLRLQGQYEDIETGLYFNRYRYYDSRIGRYLQPDPLADGQNLYAYVFNNPLNLIDPLGLCSVRQIVMGDWAEDVTLLGTAGQVALGVFGLDAPWDVSDVFANLYNRRFGSAALSAVALIPLIGALKYTDEAVEVVQGAAKGATRSDLPKYWDEYYSLVGDEGENIEDLVAGFRKRNIIVKQGIEASYRRNVITVANNTKRWEAVEEFLHHKVSQGWRQSRKKALKKELKKHRIKQIGRVAEEITVKEYMLSKSKFFGLSEAEQKLLAKQIQQLKTYGAEYGY